MFKYISRLSIVVATLLFSFMLATGCETFYDLYGTEKNPPELPFEELEPIPISAEIVYRDASSAIVGWSVTEWENYSEDFSHAYSLTLKKGNELVVRWNIPADAHIWSNYARYGCRFIFTGLEANMEYNLQVRDVSSGVELAEPLRFATGHSRVVTMPESVTSGDVILYEDFSELFITGDLSRGAANYSYDMRNLMDSADWVAKGDDPIANDVDSRGCYLVDPSTEVGMFNTIKKYIANTRLASWGMMSEDDTNGAICARAGHVKLGASAKCAWLVTPELNCLTTPVNIELSFDAALYEDDPGTALVEVLTGCTQLSNAENSFVRPTDRKTVATFDVAKEWTRYTFTIPNVQPGSRIAIGGNRNGVAGQHRFYLDNIEVVAHTMSSNQIWYTTTDNKAVTPFNPEAFGAKIVSNTYNNGQGEITFDGTVTEIGDSAFRKCKTLASIQLPSSVTALGRYAFGYCHSLESISLPERVRSIGEFAFCDCSSLVEVNMNNGLTSIAIFALFGCSSLESVVIPDNVNSIGYGVFNKCDALREFDCRFATADKRFLVVDNELIAFAPAGLTECVIPQEVTKVGDYSFHMCRALVDVTIPSSVTDIAAWSFGYCTKLTSFTIPDSVTHIGRWAFGFCGALTTVNIGVGVTSMEEGAFNDCIKLTKVYCKPITPPTLGPVVFDGNAADRKIFVPSASLNAYKSAGYWDLYKESIFALGPSVAVTGCESGVRRTIEENMTLTVALSADMGLKGLTIEIVSDTLTPEALQSVGLCDKLDFVNSLASTSSVNPSFDASGVGKVLQELGFITEDQIKGKNEVEISLTSFIAIINSLGGGEHDFIITVTDNDNYSVTYQLLLVSAVIDLTRYADLSAEGTANCYLIKSSGKYKFKAVKGNSDASVGDAQSASVLWETFGTDVKPNVGDLVTNAGYQDGYIYFSTPATFANGNASIAVHDASGTILWSWHIWCSAEGWDDDVYANNAGTMMDRNLGATSATPGNVGALGLMYQWGRKDPFMGSSSISASTLATSTGTWKTVSGSQTVDYAIENPMTYITDTDGDWCSNAWDNYEIRWKESEKSLYDPCPIGYRMPKGGVSGFWATAQISTSWDSMNNGRHWTLADGTAAWYPAVGCRNNDSGALNNVGSSGYCWSASPHPSGSSHAYYLRFSNGNVYPAGSKFRSYGYSVRCVQDIEVVPEPDVPATHKILYTSSNGNIVTPYKTDVFGVNIVSNTYENGQGVIVFDGELKKVDSQAFSGRSNLKSIKLPDSVTAIGQFAFAYSYSLEEVDMGVGVQTIGKQAFDACALRTVTIPDSVTSIARDAFLACDNLSAFYGKAASDDHCCLILNDVLCSFVSAGVSEYVIPDGVKTIAESAFNDRPQLRKITIPASVTRIEDSAFYRCYNLSEVHCKAATPPSLTGTLHFEENASGRKIYVPAASVDAYKTATYWSEYADAIVAEGGSGSSNSETNKIYYTSSNGNVVTPNRTDTFGVNIVSNTYENGQGVITFDGELVQVGENAFNNCSTLLSVTIPNSVTSIGDYAFYGCKQLTTVVMPDGVTMIGVYAFGNCDSIVNIDLPNSIKTIGESAFRGSERLVSVVLPKSLEILEYYTFHACTSLVDVQLNENLKTIEQGAFRECAFKSITIPDSVTTIEGFAFGECSNLSAFYGKGATADNRALILNNEIVAFAFNGGPTDYAIPEGVTTIASHLFYGYSRLESIYIPNSVTFIGDLAFEGCFGLKTITIPDSVDTLGQDILFNCRLSTVYFKSKTPPKTVKGKFYSSWGLFSGDISQYTIYVPAESVEAYKIAEGWSKYADIIVAEGGTSGEINENYKIYYTSTDGSVVTPNRTDAFGVNIVSNTYENGQGVITFDAAVTAIGGFAFASCDKLASVTIPQNVTQLGRAAFFRCVNLVSIAIPESVTEVDIAPFYCCSNLAEIDGKFASADKRCLIVNGVLKSFAPAGVTDYIIPCGVTEIGMEAFYSCSNLISVTIPDSVTSIESSAFSYCSSLTSVYCKPTIPPTLGGSSIFDHNATDRKIYVPAASLDAYKSAKNWSTYADAIVAEPGYQIGDLVTVNGVQGIVFQTSPVKIISVLSK